jgi:hypothetical protein
MSPTIGRCENEKMLLIDDERIRRRRHHAIIPSDWRAERFAIIIHQGVVPVASMSSDDSVAEAIMPNQSRILLVPIKGGLSILDYLWPDRAAGQDYTNE